MSNIEIRTYLRDKSGDFVDLHSSEIKSGKGSYLEGAVEIIAYHRTALSRGMWGYVEFIWWGIADMTADFAEHGSGRMDLPDIPASVTLTHHEHSWVRIEVVTWQGKVVSGSSAQRAELLSSIRDSGLSAFPRLSELKPANAISNEEAMAKLEGITIEE